MSAAGVTLVGAAVKRPRDPGSTQTSFSLREYYKEGQRPVSLFLLSSFTHCYSATKEEGPGQVSSRFLRFNIILSLWKECFFYRKVGIMSLTKELKPLHALEESMTGESANCYRTLKVYILLFKVRGTLAYIHDILQTAKSLPWALKTIFIFVPKV